MGVELNDAETAEAFAQSGQWSVSQGVFAPEQHRQAVQVQRPARGGAYAFQHLFGRTRAVYGRMGENAVFAGAALAVEQFQLVRSGQDGFRSGGRAAAVTDRGFVGHGNDVEQALIGRAGRHFGSEKAMGVFLRHERLRWAWWGGVKTERGLQPRKKSHRRV